MNQFGQFSRINQIQGKINQKTIQIIDLQQSLINQFQQINKIYKKQKDIKKQIHNIHIRLKQIKTYLANTSNYFKLLKQQIFNYLSNIVKQQIHNFTSYKSMYINNEFNQLQKFQIIDQLEIRVQLLEKQCFNYKQKIIKYQQNQQMLHNSYQNKKQILQQSLKNNQNLTNYLQEKNQEIINLNKQINQIKQNSQSLKVKFDLLLQQKNNINILKDQEIEYLKKKLQQTQKKKFFQQKQHLKQKLEVIGEQEEILSSNRQHKDELFSPNYQKYNEQNQQLKDIDSNPYIKYQEDLNNIQYICSQSKQITQQLIRQQKQKFFNQTFKIKEKKNNFQKQKVFLDEIYQKCIRRSQNIFKSKTTQFNNTQKSSSLDSKQNKTSVLKQIVLVNNKNTSTTQKSNNYKYNQKSNIKEQFKYQKLINHILQSKLKYQDVNQTQKRNSKSFKKQNIKNIIRYPIPQQILGTSFNSFNLTKYQIRYQGQKSRGQKNGRGFLQYSNGLTYQGEFFNNKRHGYGVLKLQYIQIYNGDWVNDAFHGQGRLKNCKNITTKYRNNIEQFFDWISYFGEFKYNKFHGMGTLILFNGQKYLGKFCEGVANGQGTFYKQLTMIRTNGQVEFGYWQNNKFISKIQ